MYELPTTVIVCDKEYAIRNKADYRVILDVIAACQDVDISPSEQAVSALAIFYECIEDEDEVFTAFDDIQEASKVMMSFIGCNDNEDVGYKVNRKLIDWIQDEQLIVSAINNVAKTEIRALPYMHWWTLISHYMAMGECSLSTIVGIRDKISRGKKLEKYEQEFKRNNPQYFTWKTQKTQEEKQFEDNIAELWKDSK